MCGRYGRWSRRQRIEELLGIAPSGLDDFPPLYNITPGVNTWIVRSKDGEPSLQAYLWGLVPYWSKDPTKGARPINARAESAHEKPMFRKLIRERRCLVPADCYYEWKRTPVGKTPYCIRMADGSPFFLGGMWDVWHARAADALFTFTVLTTLPNQVSGLVHDRMPLIVEPKDYARWLDPENHDVANMLAPYPAKGMSAYPVSRRVNSPKNDDAKLIEPEPA
jgi:putative SOS response-associated peptidase YedK